MHNNKKDSDDLAPYPCPSPRQDRLVAKTETLANNFKKITHGIRLFFYPLTYLPTKIENGITKKHWLERSKSIPTDELVPPKQKAIYVANKTQDFDQHFFYILKKGRIWFKPIAAPNNSHWQLFGPDGLPPNGEKLKGLSCDGLNIVAVDKSKNVYYVHTNNINYFVTENDWKIKHITLDWTDKWFAIPVINKLVGLLQDTKLTLPAHCRAFSISQKGPETAYYVDMAGKKQPEFLVGVTTLYALTTDGRIFYADPWLASKFWNEVTAPEDGQYVAENMCASASTIFLIRHDENGKPIMYTRFVDTDSMGGNPLLPATYDVKNKVPLVRFIPGEDWMQQPDIPLQYKARVNSKISVIQTGRGQYNRQLRVEGTNEKGKSGYYFKNIYEKNWHFELTPDKKVKFIQKQIITPSIDKPLDLPGQLVTKANIQLESIMLKKYLRHGFNERGLHTVIEMKLANGKKLEIPVFARRGFAQLFGQRLDSPNWQLIRPENNDPEFADILKLIFNNKKHIAVSVNDAKNADIEITHRGFKFEFKMNLSMSPRKERMAKN